MGPSRLEIMVHFSEMQFHLNGIPTEASAKPDLKKLVFTLIGAILHIS